MKIAHFNLIIEIEKELEVKLINKFGQDYSLFIAPQGKSLDFLKIGELDYNSISIYKGEKVFTSKTNKEEFWKIINFLEEDKKISVLFKELENKMKIESPELFENDINLDKNFEISTSRSQIFAYVVFPILLFGSIALYFFL